MNEKHVFSRKNYSDEINSITDHYIHLHVIVNVAEEDFAKLFTQSVTLSQDSLLDTLSVVLLLFKL